MKKGIQAQRHKEKNIRVHSRSKKLHAPCSKLHAELITNNF